jgi:hypothetical protein
MGGTQAFSTPALLRSIRSFNHAAHDARAAWQPSLPLELAFLESCESPPEISGETQLSPATPIQAVVKTATPSLPKEVKETSPRPVTSEENPLPVTDDTQTLNQHWAKVLSLVRKQNPNTYGLLTPAARYLDGKVLHWVLPVMCSEPMSRRKT